MQTLSRDFLLPSLCTIIAGLSFNALNSVQTNFKSSVKAGAIFSKVFVKKIMTTDKEKSSVETQPKIQIWKDEAPETESTAASASDVNSDAAAEESEAEQMRKEALTERD